jgi:tetratricopeptide (TPR) repeat protein
VLTSAAEYERARPLVEDSLAIFRARGEMQSIAYALQQLGIIALHLGDFAQAVATYEETIAITESLGDRLGQGNGLLNLGSALEMSGDFDGALTKLRQARLIFDDIQDVGGVGFVDYLSGHTLRSQGKQEEGRVRLIAAIERLAGVGDRQALAEALEALAGVELDLNRATNAAALIGHAERIREESGSPVPLNRAQEVHRDRANIVRELGNEAFTAEIERGRHADPVELLELIQHDS